MKRKGIIRIIAVPNPVLAGYRAWAKIGIKVVPGSLFDVVHKLVGYRPIYFVAHSLGTFDIMIAVHFDTMEKLTYFVNSELIKLKGVLSTETMILMCPRKYYNFSWPEPVLEKKNMEHYYDVTTSYSVCKIDDTDRTIINALMEDALLPARILKTRLGIGESTIRTRIKKMLKEEVIKIEAVPNPESLEYEVWATMGLIISHQFAHKVIDTILQNPAVYLASVSLGRFNIVISTRFHNIGLLNEFISMELAKTDGVVTVETFLHTKVLKYHNIKW
jgi:Lrp/AsnC family transcriptional regulator for asnA, asnC and gidA